MAFTGLFVFAILAYSTCINAYIYYPILLYTDIVSSNDTQVLRYPDRPTMFKATFYSGQALGNLCGEVDEDSFQVRPKRVWTSPGRLH